MGFSNRKFSVCVLVLAGLLFGEKVEATDLEFDKKIMIDFASDQVQFFGVYSPSQNGKRPGLEAEILARRNGVMNFNSRLRSSCGISDLSQLAAPRWRASVKSRGSEIYLNGVLKISLVAPLREVFHDISQRPSVLKTREGNPITLRFPKLTLAHFKCGLLSVNVAGKTVDLNPFASSSESIAKVVTLELEGSALRPVSTTDLAVLQNSTLFGLKELNSNTTDVPPEPLTSTLPTAN